MEKKQRFIVTAKASAGRSLELQPEGMGLSFVGSIKTHWVVSDNNGVGFTYRQAYAFIAKQPPIEGVEYVIINHRKN